MAYLGLLLIFLPVAAQAQQYLKDAKIFLKLKNEKIIYFDPQDFKICERDSNKTSQKAVKLNQDLKSSKASLRQTEASLQQTNRSIRIAKARLARIEGDIAKAKRSRRKYQQLAAESRAKAANIERGNPRDRYISRRNQAKATTKRVSRYKNRASLLVGYDPEGRLSVVPSQRDDGGITYLIVPEPAILFGVSFSRDLGRVPITMSYILPNKFTLGLGLAF